MGNSCEGRVALVTGASQGGTGTGLAIRLAAEGARVAITARSEAGLRETQQRIEALGGSAHAVRPLGGWKYARTQRPLGSTGSAAASPGGGSHAIRTSTRSKQQGIHSAAAAAAASPATAASAAAACSMVRAQMAPTTTSVP